MQQNQISIPLLKVQLAKGARLVQRGPGAFPRLREGDLVRQDRGVGSIEVRRLRGEGHCTD